MESIGDITQKFSDVYLLPAIASTFMAIIYLAYKCDGTNLRKKPLKFVKEIFYAKEDIETDAENSKLLPEPTIPLNVSSTIFLPSTVKIHVENECFKEYPSKMCTVKCCDETGNGMECQYSNISLVTNENSMPLTSENSHKTFCSSDISNVKESFCNVELSSEPNVFKTHLDPNGKCSRETGNIVSLETNDNSTLLPSLGNFYETVKDKLPRTSSFSLDISYEKEPLWDYYGVFYPSEVQAVTKRGDFNPEKFTCVQNRDAFYPSCVQAVTSSGEFNSEEFACDQTRDAFYSSNVHVVTSSGEFNPEKFAWDQNRESFDFPDVTAVKTSGDFDPEKNTCVENRDAYVNIYEEPDFETEKDEDTFNSDSLEDSTSEKFKLTRFTNYLQLVY